ncbi:hypothetical protein Ancab_015970 [Ancistrocladus abbreviatus]
MAPKSETSGTKVVNKGAWTAEEDRRLAEYIKEHGAKRWKTIALKAGLNRCGKSCRLRWLNYLRPNIKRGNISDEEEDLILRLHNLLGNRWALIAGRLPGRTDNEINNYWNSHLSKKVNQKGKEMETPTAAPVTMTQTPCTNAEEEKKSEVVGNTGDMQINFDIDDFFYLSAEGTQSLDWLSRFLELENDPNLLIEEKVNK